MNPTLKEILWIFFFFLFSFYGVSATWPPSLSFSSLNSSLYAYGPDSATVGGAVASDDFDGDSIADIAVGAPVYFNGAIYLIFGRTDIASQPISLSTLDGNNGFSIIGEENGDLFGTSISFLDYNGDRLADLLISAPGHDLNNGSCYLIFGQQRPLSFGSSLDLSLLSSNGFSLSGSSEERFGSSTAGGDVNGDSFDDILIGSVTSVYIYFGAANATTTSSFVTIQGEGVNVAFAVSLVTSIGPDINGDQISDIAIGSPAYTSNGLLSTGRTYVIFGTTNWNPITSVLNLNGSGGFIVDSTVKNARHGASITICDFNNDGFADVLSSSPFASNNGGGGGIVYVIKGTNQTYSPLIDLNSITPAVAFPIYGANADQQLGFSLSCGGDFNVDGIPDLAIGATEYSVNPFKLGAVYVVFGSSFFGPQIYLNDLDGTTGFVLIGSSSQDSAGAAVSLITDINGDLITDLIATATQLSSTNQGSGLVYGVFGLETVIPTTVPPTLSPTLAPTVDSPTLNSNLPSQIPTVTAPSGPNSTFPTTNFPDTSAPTSPPALNTSTLMPTLAPISNTTNTTIAPTTVLPTQSLTPPPTDLPATMTPTTRRPTSTRAPTLPATKNPVRPTIFIIDPNSARSGSLNLATLVVGLFLSWFLRYQI